MTERKTSLKPRILTGKLSLSDRFGITIIYLSPDQEKYLEIVEGIAKSKGINIEPENSGRWPLNGTMATAVQVELPNSL